MKTLRVSLADIEGKPHGSHHANTNVAVTARYTGPVTLADGRIVPAVIKAKQLSTGSTGYVDFEVYASDDPLVHADWRGFAIIVTATIKHARSGQQLGQVARTVKVLESHASTVALGSLEPAEGLPREWVSVEEVAAALRKAAGKGDMSRRGLIPLLRAMEAGEARIVVMGDSNSEGFLLNRWDERWMNVLRDRLRTRWGLTGDTGQGYLPATYNTLGATPPKPARGGAAGNTTPITNLGGLGLRSMWMKGDGTVAWPALTFSATTPLRVLINRRPLHGSIEILVDGVVKATVATVGTDAIIPVDITVTAGTHTVSARGQGGATVQIAGIEHRTGQGVAVYDGALSGATARTFTDPSPGQALHWSEVQRINPHLLIVALGANDMAPGQTYSRTPQEWENGLRAIVALRDQHAPNAGLLLLHGAAPANDPAGLDRVREYEARARAALEDAPRTSILYLSSLWQPRLDHTYTLMSSDPDGWLTDGVHMTAAAHSQVADLILGALASGMPATSGGTPSSVPWTGITGKPTTFPPTSHAASHATGGSDPITPESIGASPAGHAHAAAAITDLTETVQDIVGALIKAGTGTTVSYDDDAGTVTITATATGGSTDPEIVRDVIGSAMVAGSGIQITVNDAGDTITIASTAVLPTRKVNAGTGLTGGGDLSADRTLSVSYGTTAGTAAQGNDVRLSDARTPTAHSHAADDVTSGTFAPARLGTGTPSASTVLYGDGAWKDAPNGGGGGLATGDVQFAVARSGTATSLAPDAFTTYPLDGTPTVNIGGGTWNASTFVYTVPEDGLYLCLGAIRIADGAAPRNVMLAIHTSNVDGPFGLWQNMGGTTRSGVQYTRLARFSAGDGVRMYFYSEGTAFMTQYDTGGSVAGGQSMSITKVAD